MYYENDIQKITKKIQSLFHSQMLVQGQGGRAPLRLCSLCGPTIDIAHQLKKYFLCVITSVLGAFSGLYFFLKNC
jgi:hypothetical protein